MSYRRLRTAMIDAERRAVVELRDRGIIGSDVLRRIERDLDLEVILLEETTLDGQSLPPSQPKRSPVATPRSGEHRGASADPTVE